jgi:predicted PurR-regulated permease PerM
MTKSHRSPGSSSIRTTAIVIAAVAVLYLAREILIPLAFAITLALVLTPAITWLRKLRVGRAPAVLLVMVVSIAAAGGISWVIFNQLVDVLSELPQYRLNIHNKIEAMRSPSNGPLGRAAEGVKALGKELAPPPPPPPVSDPTNRRDRTNTRGKQNQTERPQPVQIVAEPANEFQYFRDLTKPFLAPLAQLGIVLIFTVFLLIEESDLRNRLLRLVGLDQLNLVTQALDDATKRVSRYLLMQLVVNVCFGVFCGIGLYLIGVPYAALWGTVAAMLRVVPYVGAPVAGLLPLVVALAVFDSWRPPVYVFLLFAAAEVITGNFIEPWLYGVHTGISALALLLTTVFWTTLWGPAGLILSTPLTVCVVILGRYVPQLSFLHILLGDEPVLAAEAQVYQRLLAMDDMEARAVVDRFLSENSLLELYDSVFIPALTLAEQDRHKGALDAAREEFLFLSVKEMLAEFSSEAQKSGDEPARQPGAQESASRILCVPANDEADEIVATMLAQLLEQSGFPVTLFPLEASLQRSIELVEPSEKDVFCISALPPFAFARARTLCRQLRSRYPRTKIIAGVWGFSGDTERALERFHTPRPDKLVTRLAEALEYIRDLERSPAQKRPLLSVYD